jgi:hypothetical protein
MATDNPLSDIADYEWNDPRVFNLRRARDHQFLETLLAIRALEETRFDSAAPLATDIHASVGPFEDVLREPVARVFNMDVRTSRETAYRWIVGYFCDHVAALRMLEQQLWGRSLGEEP